MTPSDVINWAIALMDFGFAVAAIVVVAAAIYSICKEL
jgi:hypothetical protein